MSDTGIPAPHFLRREITEECQRVLRVVGDANADLRMIAREAKELPAFSRRIMASANSAGRRGRYRIEDVEHAVVLLGAERIKELAVKTLADVAKLSDRTETVHRELPQSPTTVSDGFSGQRAG